MSTCDRLDLQTLESQPVMPKNLPGHCSKLIGNFSITLVESMEHSSIDKENRKVPTCYRLDSETLGSRPVMSKNLP